MIYSRKYAECYDLFYRDKPYREEAEYAARLIRERLPGGKTLFDLGCGTGLRSLALARLGFRVFGIDQSSGMLTTAREHLAASGIPASDVEFQNGDITTPSRGEGQRKVVMSPF
jgi:2-polyprenyl-3-methyl-5-hydroxy-6-metoxy-1,4-benzoquinol methylase